ncbi:MAG: sulfocyanin-like copper-binding protein [Acidimicrobiales bacterium]|nr:sulfocyanin-like copper-binding protein [Actinomycetota bacterium]
MTTLTTKSPDPLSDPGQPSPTPSVKRRARLAAIVGAAVLVVGGLGAGLAFAVGESSSPPTASTAATSGAMYSYYSSMMGRLYGPSMMGNSSYGSMMGSSGYEWMMGGTEAPGWMRGGSLPSYMMGSGSDPGKIMGSLFANAPGPRVSATEAAQLGNRTPAGASINRAANRITFSSSTVGLAVEASPAGGPDETFRISGMVNPTIVVPQGSQVTIEVVNADPDTAHGLVVTASGSSSSWMPMMTTRPAFASSALWFLGNPTSAGMHAATLRFTAATPGTYQYLCPVPGHAQKGMIGTLDVAAAGS